MPISLYKKTITELQQLYGNYIESYSGIYVNDWVTGAMTVRDLDWRSIAVNENNGHMIAVNNNASNVVTNNFAYSDTSGITWENFNSVASGVTPSNTNSLWRGVTFGSDRFVGISASGTSNNVAKVFYSNNNAPRSQVDFSYTRTNIPNNNWEAITFGNGYFIAVASSGTNRVIRSRDGITWDTINDSDANDASCRAIAYSEKLKRFVVLTNNSNKKIIFSDYDGREWSSSNVPSLISFIINSIVWSPKLNIFVLVGNNGVISTSSNGASWNTFTISPSLNFESVIWSQELEIFVAISSTTGTTSKIITSVDGVNWVFRTTSESVPTFKVIVWNRYFGTFVALANSGASGSRLIITKAIGDNILLEKNNYLPQIDDFFINFNYTIQKIHVTTSKEINVYPIINESRSLIFSLADETQILPSGLTLNPNSGQITGTTISTSPLTQYKIKATSEIEERSFYSYLEILVSSTELEIKDFSYSTNYIEKDLNDNYIFLFPSFSQGTNIVYSVSPAFLGSSGLSLNIESGIISGILSSVFDQGFIITATNTISNGYKQFNIEIVSHVLKFKLKTNEIEVTNSNAIIDGRNEELFDFSLGYISKNSYSNRFYGSNKGSLSKNFFYDRNNNFLPDMIKSLITFYRIKKSDNSVFEIFLLLEIKGNLTNPPNPLNWNQISFRGNTYLKNEATVFYDSTLDSTIFKFNKPFEANFIQNNFTDIIID